jgi:hypothetical protein
LKEPLSLTKISEEVPWLLFQSSRLRLVTCLPIFPLMSSLSLMAKFSWKLNCSTRVSDLLLTSVCQSAESAQLPRSRPWSKSLVN